MQSDFKEGSPITWKGELKGKPYEDKGEILKADPNHELRFTHFSPLTGQEDTPENDHVVSFKLNALGKQTQIELSQTNANGEVKPDDMMNRAQYEQNWSKMLESLAKLLKS